MPETHGACEEKSEICSFLVFRLGEIRTIHKIQVNHNQQQQNIGFFGQVSP
jgi:hypothetical protein